METVASMASGKLGEICSEHPKMPQKAGEGKILGFEVSFFPSWKDCIVFADLSVSEKSLRRDYEPH